MLQTTPATHPAVKPAPLNFQRAITSKMPMLRSYAISLCKKRDLADDLVQDTMLKALTNHGRYEPGTNIDAWLIVILRNTFLSRIRRQAREVEDVDGIYANAVPVKPNQLGYEDTVALEQVEKMLDGMAPEMAGSVRAIADGMTYEQTAQKLGCSVGAVKSRVHRGRTILSDLNEDKPQARVVSNQGLDESATDLRRIETASFAGVQARPKDAMGPVPQLDWIAISKLRIDPRYQREITKTGRTNVHKIARDFDWTKFAPVIVAPLDGKTFAIVDGQHRTTAAALCNIEKVPCQIISARPDQQAAAFAAINGNITQMSILQVHAAELAAGDEKAVRLDRVCQAGGVKILRYPVPANKIAKGRTLAVAALRQSLRQYGEEVLVTALDCLTKTGEGNRGMLRGPVIKALCIALEGSPLVHHRAKALQAAEAINFQRVFLDANVDAKRSHRPITAALADLLRPFFQSKAAA